MSKVEGWFSRLVPGQDRWDAGTAVEPRVATEAERLAARAEECRDAGDKDQAIVLFERALELNPRLVSAWINLGSMLRQFWRPKAALACLERAQRLAGGNGNLQIFISQLIPICRNEAAGAEGDEEAEVWLRKGYKAENDGCLENAMDYYQHARFLNPKNPRVFVLLGGALLSAGRDSEAMQIFEEARRLNDPETNALITDMLTG
jgi:tetratricopeptide (TPR) repeat protein